MLTRPVPQYTARLNQAISSIQELLDALGPRPTPPDTTSEEGPPPEAVLARVWPLAERCGQVLEPELRLRTPALSPAGGNARFLERPARPGSASDPGDDAGEQPAAADMLAALEARAHEWLTGLSGKLGDLLRHEEACLGVDMSFANHVEPGRLRKELASWLNDFLPGIENVYTPVLPERAAVLLHDIATGEPPSVH